MEQYYAHRAEDGRLQTVGEHLKNTARLAEEFARPLGLELWARACGLAHDLGKYSRGFQRRLLEQGPGSMDQSAIDQLVHHREALPPGTPLDKGVNFSTLSRIRRFFDENPEHFFTSEQIAEHVGLSRITVRRYVNYMVDQGEITSSIDYQTGGRPSIRYLRLHS